MATRSDAGIVLRLSDYSETSQIATLLSRESGLVRLIAKGVRRSTAARVAVGLDLLERGDLLFAPPVRGTGLGTLAEWRQRDAFAGLRRALILMHAGLYAAELCRVLMEEYDPHPDVYDGLQSLLEALAQIEPAKRDAVAGLLVDFQAILAVSVGFCPNLRGCVACGRARPAGSAGYMSHSAGGLVCRSCVARFSDRRRVRGMVIDRLWQSIAAATPTMPDAEPEAEASVDAAEIGRSGMGGSAVPARNSQAGASAEWEAAELLGEHLSLTAGRRIEVFDLLTRQLVRGRGGRAAGASGGAEGAEPAGGVG
ncbi:MAG: DNA repair protein RecO [Phycisphaerales bacterium]|nr:DNA repair protein RecO [Phycisphaerales bacterium]